MLQTYRENSFAKWPEKVKQTPKTLSEAGFFYCKLSDYVRCFHCGNGLCNWEKDADPWQEHAKWYPECDYVIEKKGQEYIDRVKRKCIQSTDIPSRRFITEEDLDTLMELDINQYVLKMGFRDDAVRKALRKKLETTGLPFLKLENCLEAVFQEMRDDHHS